jgi:hypothetical protein
MAQIIALFEIDDYDAWKQRFDLDPAGRGDTATGHSILRNVDNPKEVLLTIAFPTVDDAKALLERLIASPPPPPEEGMTLKLQPTIFELVDDSEP